MKKVGNIKEKSIIKVISFVLFLSMVISYILPVYEEVNISLLSNKSKALATLEQETANNPILLPGMKAIYWENGAEKELKEPLNNKGTWYNYSEKKWANAKTKDGSYWVWIPLFAYKIDYFTDASKTQDTYKGSRQNNEYVNAAGKRVDNPDEVQTEHYKVNIKYINDSSKVPEGYTIHPAFYKAGDGQQSQVMGQGFWIAKYRASENGKNPKFVPNRDSETNISVSEAFDKVDKLALEGNTYGFDDSFVNSGLPRNVEIGALEYLTLSEKGLNQNVPEKTGVGKKTANPETSTSTTGNITGVYDIDNQIAEMTSSYILNGSANLSKYGAKLQPTNTDKVGTKDITIDAKIEKYSFKTPETTVEENYKELKKDRYIHYGDGVYEFKNAMDRNNERYPLKDKPFFIRGLNTENGLSQAFGKYLGHTGEGHNELSYRASLYVFPKERDNKINFSISTSDGKLYNRQTGESYGYTTFSGKITKGAILPNEYTVKESNKKFIGWDKEIFGTPLYENITVHAVFEEDGNNDNPVTPEPQNRYTVTFKDTETGTIYGQTTVNRGEKVESANIPTNVNKLGYKFKGWSKDPSNTVINEDTIFEAVFEKEAKLKTEYTVKYNVDNNTIFQVKAIENGYAPIPNDIPRKEGKIFKGWTPDPAKTIINRDTVFEAQFIEEPQGDLITLTVKLNGGNSLKLYEGQKLKIKKGTKLNSPENSEVYSVITNGTPNKRGYLFKGWSIDENKVLNEDAEISAEYKEGLYKAKFIYEYTDFDGTLKERTYIRELEKGTSPESVAPSDTRKNGYIFEKWTPDPTKVYSEDVEFRAVYTKLSESDQFNSNIEITFDYNGGYVAIGENRRENKRVFNILKNQYIIDTPKPYREGYNFKGWVGDSNVNDKQEKSTTYIATWEKITSKSNNTEQSNNTSKPNDNNKNINLEGQPINSVNNKQNYSPITGLRPLENQNTDNGYLNLNTGVTTGIKEGVVPKTQQLREDYPYSGLNDGIFKVLLVIGIPILIVSIAFSIIKLRELKTK